jgi:ribonucleotide monophosphatase NagD (HAD superfamily)
MQSGYRAPGNACCISAIESSLRKPGSSSLICEKIVTGKPNPDIVNLIRRQHNIPESHLSKMVMIGDRPDTDIALGNNAGIATCLVLTGVVQNQEQLIQFCRQSDSHKPGFVLHSFGQDPDFVNGEHSASIDLE